MKWSALAESDVVLYAARVTVWGRWVIWLVGAVVLAHRPSLRFPEDIDDGGGLSEDYAERGRGFTGMETDAKRMAHRGVGRTGTGDDHHLRGPLRVTW